MSKLALVTVFTLAAVGSVRGESPLVIDPNDFSHPNRASEFQKDKWLEGLKTKYDGKTVQFSGTSFRLSGQIDDSHRFIYSLSIDNHPVAKNTSSKVVVAAVIFLDNADAEKIISDGKAAGKMRGRDRIIVDLLVTGTAKILTDRIHRDAPLMIIDAKVAK